MGEKGVKSRSYRDLEVWKSAVAFVKEIYLITAKFPPSEIYGLTGQIRRASVSIPSNIAKGDREETRAKSFASFWALPLGQ
jgi:four helix bundle protein